MYKIPLLHFEQKDEVIDGKYLQVKVVNPKIPIHGLLLNEYCLESGFVLVALETADNQIDFNRLFIDNFEDESNCDYRWTQYREIVLRSQPYMPDPITKCCFIFADGFNYSAVLRKSGAFDLYWNMMRKYSSSDSKFSSEITRFRTCE